MQPIVRALFLASAVACAAPACAQELTVGAVRTFTADIDAATAACDVDAIVDRIAELAVITLTGNVNGSIGVLRMNKAKYREFMTITCEAATSHEYVRTNEHISIEGDQAIVTAEVHETTVVQGREIKTAAHERATVENVDGKLMLTQLVATQLE